MSLQSDNVRFFLKQSNQGDHMKLGVKILLTSTMLFSLSACSTIFGDNDRIVHVNSTPKDATITIDNVTVDSKTPTQMVITKMWSPTIITIQKPGCSPTSVVIQPAFQKVGLWNILVFPGFIIDAITGDMMKVPKDQRNINAKLC